MSDTNISKKEMHDIIQKCVYSSKIQEDSAKTFTIYLIDKLKKIWTCLAVNKCEDTDSWLIHSRTAIIGFYFLCEPTEIFYDILQPFFSINTENNEIFIPKLNIKIIVQTVETFKVSLKYGLINLLIIRKDIYSELQLKDFYKDIFVHCHEQTRHNHVYFQLLHLFIKNFEQYLSEQDYDNIFDLLYFYLCKKECSSILKYVLNKSEKTRTKTILLTFISDISWKYKYKYIILSEIIAFNPLSVSDLPHREIVKVLIFAQSKPYLTSAATKLYNSIIKQLSMELWMQEYFSELEKVISKTGSPTLCQKNILKFYMASPLTKYHNLFENIFEKIISLDEKPIFTILSLAVIGIKHKLFIKDYVFTEIINLGCFHTDDCVRNLAFEIICWTQVIDNSTTYKNMKNFILLNINNADQSSRDSIKKSFKKFILRLQSAIMHLNKIDKTVDIVILSSEFLNWLILYLLKQFTKSSNYQRITLSLTLLNIILKHFSKKPNVGNKKVLENMSKYIKHVEVIYNLEEYFPKFIDMLLLCNMEEKEKIFNIIFNEFNDLPQKILTDIWSCGLNKICNSNMEVAENGQKLIEFIIRSQTEDQSQNLQVLEEIMYKQWQEIKNSEEENVVEINPLHPLISLASTLLDLYNIEQYEKLWVFLEDIVPVLLKVFELRAMLPFTGEFCKGIAKAFKNENSVYHACTVNCMWLVLKASCRLAKEITSILKTDDSMRRTLQINYAIIKKCYHKGALEVSGDTLKDVIASATKNNYNVHVIDEFLEEIFEKIPQATEISSTVRRAAETRIMLSSIAVSDRRIHKPFLHKTMKFLIEILKSCLDNLNSDSAAPVHCLVLHCLQPIVMDTSGEIHVVEYLNDIMICSVNSFESTNWKVRNAALQTFGAVSNKLLRTALSSNDDSPEHHAVCLEEIFFKHPQIYNFIINKLKKTDPKNSNHLNVIIPILSFLSMSYVRGNMISLVTTCQIQKLSDCVQKYIFTASNMHVIILAAKAYAALCCHKNIQNEITKIGNNILFQNNNTYFSSMYTLKVLSDKLIEDIPYDNTIKNIILKQLDSILNPLKDATVWHKVIFGLLLFRPGLKSINSKDFENNLDYLCSTPNISFVLPGVWIWFENKLKLILETENISGLSNLIKKCLFENLSLDIKVLCLKVIKNRVVICEETKKVCEKELIDSLFQLLYQMKHPRYVLEYCIYLILKIDVSFLNNELRNRLLENITKFPAYYYPALCPVLINHFNNSPEAKLFFHSCAEQCLKSLEEVNVDILTLKSVIFICKYAKLNSDNNLIVLVLEITYKMLQIGDEELNFECEKVYSLCFHSKPKHAYANILNMINKQKLCDLIGIFLALRFLISLYVERKDDEMYSINVFDRKHTLSIETSVIQEHLLENIHYIYEKMSLSQRDQFKSWFSEYKSSKLNNNYLKHLAALFEI